MKAIKRKELALALLVYHLPNLRTLEIAGRFSNMPYLKGAVAHAVSSHANPESKQKAMSRLSKVNLFCANGADNASLGDISGELPANVVSAFIRLPSMKVFSASNVKSRRFEVARDIPQPEITTLCLLEQDLSPFALRTLLERSTKLRSLTLTAKPQTVNFQLHLTLDVLPSTAYSSLEDLTLHVSAHSSTPRNSSSPDQPISFAAFTSLKRLSVTFDALNLPASGAPILQIHNQTPAQALNPLLPPTLLSLEIVSSSYHTRLINDILDLLHTFHTTHPHLASIVLRTWLSDDDRAALKRACQELGIACGRDHTEALASTRVEVEAGTPDATTGLDLEPEQEQNPTAKARPGQRMVLQVTPPPLTPAPKKTNVGSRGTRVAERRGATGPGWWDGEVRLDEMR